MVLSVWLPVPVKQNSTTDVFVMSRPLCLCPFEGLKHGVSLQISINLGDTLLRIAREWKTAETWLSYPRFLNLFTEWLRFLILITWLVKTENKWRVSASSMFSRHWAESRNTTTVTVPASHGINQSELSNFGLRRLQLNKHSKSFDYLKSVCLRDRKTLDNSWQQQNTHFACDQGTTLSWKLQVSQKHNKHRYHAIIEQISLSHFTIQSFERSPQYHWFLLRSLLS